MSDLTAITQRIDSKYFYYQPSRYDQNKLVALTDCTVGDLLRASGISAHYNTSPHKKQWAAAEALPNALKMMNKSSKWHYGYTLQV